MIIEGLLSVIKFIVLGFVRMLPTLPAVNIGYLDGVFQILSLTDLLVNVKLLAACLGVLLLFMNFELIWSLIMWVARKLPFIK